MLAVRMVGIRMSAVDAANHSLLLGGKVSGSMERMGSTWWNGAGRLPPETVKMVRAAHAAGLGDKEISLATGLSRAMVKKIRSGRRHKA